MAKVTGVGGVFFKSKGDSRALAAWYRKHLGMPLEDLAALSSAWIMDPDENKIELWEPKVWDDKNKGT